MPLPPDIGVTITAEPQSSNRRRRAMLGQGIRLRLRYYDRDTGLAVAVDDPVLTVYPPATTAEPLPVPMTVPLTVDGTGLWHADIGGDKAGTWTARATCTSPNAAAEEIRFDMTTSGGVVPNPAAPMLATEDLWPVRTESGGVLTGARIPALPEITDPAGTAFAGAKAGASGHVTWETLKADVDAAGAAAAEASVAAEATARQQGDAGMLAIANAHSDAHAARADNPHAVTAAQVGAYTRAQVDDALAGAAQKSANLADLANVSAARTNLGLGSIATQAANAVAITGGSISGITTLSARSGAGLVTIAGDATNGSMSLGSTGVAGTPYIDLKNNNIASGYNVRLISNAANQLQMFGGTGAGTALLNVDGRVTAKTVAQTGTLTYSGAAIAAGQPAIYQSIAASGTTTAPSVAANHIVLSLDQVDCPEMSGLYVRHQIGGNAKGYRNGIKSYINLASTPAGGGDICGIQTGGYLDAPINSNGGLWGINSNVWLTPNSNDPGTALYSGEFNLHAEAGSAPRNKVGIGIIVNTADAVRGSVVDAGLVISAKGGSTTPGWTRGISFGTSNAWWPFAADSTIIGAAPGPVDNPSPPYKALYGIDFRLVQFQAGGAAFASPGFSVDGSGNITSTGLAARNFANDAAAAAGGVPVGGLYHNAGAARVRLV